MSSFEASRAQGTAHADAPLECELFDEAALLELVVRGGDSEDVAIAFAVPRAGSDLSALREQLTARSLRLGRRITPVFVDRIPRTKSGEVDEEALAEVPVIESRLIRRHRDDLRMLLGSSEFELRIEPVSSASPLEPVPRPALPATAPGAPRAHARGPPLQWPTTFPSSLSEALAAAAQRYPTHGVIAYDADGAAVVLSYPELLQRARRTAGGLHDAGMRPGDVVLIVTPALADYFHALWSCLLAALVPVTLAPPPLYDERSAALDRIHATWSRCGRPWLIASGEAVEGLQAMQRLYDDAPQIVDAATCAEAEPLAPLPVGGEVAMLQLSSGTTGRPKLTQIGHRALFSFVLGDRCSSGIAEADLLVNWLPLDHIGSLLLFHIRGVVLGATNIHAPTRWVIEEPLRWLDLLERHDAQDTWSPNFGFRMLANAVDQTPSRHWDLSAMRRLVNGGEQCTLPVVEHFLRSTKRFGLGPQHVTLAWGMTETTTAITYKRFDEAGVVRQAPAGASGVLLSCGSPSPNSEMRVVEEHGATLPERVIGRLLVRSERITPGYLNGDEVEAVVDEDGWFDTGDLAFIEDGEIVITGRAKDVIIVNGQNILAHEVEHAVEEVDGVRSGWVAACGVPSRKSGSEGLAVVYVPVSEADAEIDAELRAAVLAAVGVAPTIVRAVSECDFPRTGSGKIQRTTLREQVLEIGTDETGEPSDAAASGPSSFIAYEPCWTPLRRTACGGRRLRPPTLVVCADGPGHELAVTAERLGLLESRIDVVAADACADEGSRFTIRLAEPADWEALGDALRQCRPQSVLFLMSYLPDDGWDPRATSARDPSQSPCVIAYRELARTLLTCGFSGEVLSVSRKLHRVAPDDDGSPVAALTAGLALALRHEANAIDAWHLDLPGTSTAADARALADAAAARRAEVELAWRDDRPYARRLRATRAPTAQEDVNGHFGDRAIVAIGGLGGVGRAMLPGLLGGGMARLLVVGRTPAEQLPTTSGTDTLAHLASCCRDVRYSTAPAEDRRALRRVVEQAEEDWGEPITIGLHCAGVYVQGLLSELGAAEWSAQVAGKADGLVNLAAILAERPRASLVVMSSLLSYLGAAACPTYIAANRFLEACCEAINCDRSIEARCLSWSNWYETGVSAGWASTTREAPPGCLLLPPDVGRALTAWAMHEPPAVRLLGLDPTHARVRSEQADGAVRAIEQLVVELPEPAAGTPLPRLRDARGRPIAQRLSVRPPTAALPEKLAAPVESVAASDVAACVAAVFEGLVDGPVQADRPFGELGLSSIDLIKAHSQLEARLGRRLAQTTLFEFTTVDALAAHLAQDAAPAAGTHIAARRPNELREAIAVVGVACRFPGARTPAEYWALLREGRTAVHRFALDELREAGVAEELLSDPDYVPVTGSLDGVDRFAPEAFGMTAREAMLTSPQQRLLLEVAHELLVTSGYDAVDGDSSIGVFAGTGMHLSALNTYLLTTLRHSIDWHDPVAALQVVIGNEPDFAATRIAHRLGLTGPAVNVQTACSTSLSALHVARRSLLAGDCDVAIVGAGAIHVPHPSGYLYRKGSIFSPNGACRAFDAEADGTVMGNGVAALLIKPLAAARADGDVIHAVVRGSAINNDGSSKVGFAAPSVQGQVAVVRRALASSETPADTVSYVQAHATGTPKGDPIEVEALTRAFATSSSRPGYCLLGSVKPNVGHLDTCAGLAGLIAAMLALEHREAPPQINYATPNPALGLGDGPFRIAREPEPLEPSAGPLRACVSALGVGGTNVHVVLEAPK